MPKLRVHNFSISIEGLGVDGLRRRAARRTTNALWMTLYGAGAASVIWWGGNYRWLGLAAWALVSLALGIAGVVQLLTIRSREAASRARRQFDRRLARKIGGLIGIYTVVEAISALGLHALRLDPLIFPIAIAIAGVHFWAFAWVLGVWQYIVTGMLDCLFVLITLLAVTSASMVGSMPAWIFYPLLGGGVALLVTAALMLYESDGLIRRDAAGLGSSDRQ
jgi:hypothetical protein